MRVIAGSAKGRILRPPRTSATRPITDRAKESLFAILAPRLPGARFLDLFAGTGSVGIEALSRGCAHATFVERSAGALVIAQHDPAESTALDLGRLETTDERTYARVRFTFFRPSHG